MAYNKKKVCVINSLFLSQNLLFSPSKPFSRGQNYIPHDIDLMIDCFVSCFRIKPHNNEALKVCLNPTSSFLYHYVLISSLYRYDLLTVCFIDIRQLSEIVSVWSTLLCAVLLCGIHSDDIWTHPDLHNRCVWEDLAQVEFCASYN